jgi:hypothetical protein
MLHLQRYESVASKVNKVLQDKFNAEAQAMALPGMHDYNGWCVIMYCHSKRTCCTLATSFMAPAYHGDLSDIERQHALAT